MGKRGQKRENRTYSRAVLSVQRASLTAALLPPYPESARLENRQHVKVSESNISSYTPIYDERSE